jgi:hypothetical protein
MKLGDENSDWTTPLVRQYFQTGRSGFAYLDCPDELRPPDVFPDTWWVIYAPGYDGGFIIEGYLIDEWRYRQQTFVTFWLIAGVLVGYPPALGLQFGFVLAFIIIWFAVLFFGSYLLSRSLFANRVWVAFPAQLQEALQAQRDLETKEEKKDRKREAISDTIGRVVGAASGFLVETAIGTASAQAGKVAGKASEMLVEAACKALAHRMMK